MNSFVLGVLAGLGFSVVVFIIWLFWSIRDLDENAESRSNE